MLDYLGFPHQQEDVQRFVAAVDKLETDGKISPDEFLKVVGSFGGCCKLFEMRRKQIEARGTELEVPEDVKESDLRCQLLSCGILDDELATWKPVVSSADMKATASLQPCQMEALQHVRNLARINHEKALPELTEKFQSMGYNVQDMWMTLAWIRELAPIIIHINLPAIGDFLARDSHYRNQFETQNSGGLLDLNVRNSWEGSLFGRAYEDADPFHRPKYGVLNVWNDPYGIYGCEQYGDSYLVLKDLRLRCTLAPQDSGGLPAQRLAVLDYYAHTLLEYSQEELEETVKLARHGHEKLGDSEALCHDWGKYKEVQIHGEIDLTKNVERIVINERHKARKSQYEEMAAQKGWQIVWVEEMAQELKAKALGKELTRKEFDSILVPWRHKRERS
ncbi:Calcium-dependent protein kinase 15 [Durusdinium trenchii]|uniref:Calcium-dependent protein kinase 15 n=1 Tax=Durusdinium trenchii TaxID=1381693 RepID=A0ABP0PAG2_9DINO